MSIDLDALQLPTLEELRARGSATPGRELTAEEKAKAQADKAKKPTPFHTKKLSENLCRKHFKDLLGVELTKVADTKRKFGDRTFYVSEDVDFRGNIFLRVAGVTRCYPLRVESKAVTLKRQWRQHKVKLAGSFPLSSLTDIQRLYLTENKVRGGLSIIYLTWWLEKSCQAAFMVHLNSWMEVESILQERALGNFKGKSLRFEDCDLLSTSEIWYANRDNKWWLPISHWIKPYLVDQNQPQLNLPL